MGNEKRNQIPLMEISTLGDFNININNHTLFKETGRAYKEVKLFQYLLAFRGKKLLPETIIENLEPENEYNDPRNVLRTQIFRLRRTLGQFSSAGRKPGEQDYCRIIFSRGYYMLELSEYVVLDVEEFDRLINIADLARMTNPDEAISLYKQAIDLYKGDYLSGCNCDAWVVPVRNHYNRVYLQALFSLIELLNKKGDHTQVIDICEKALIIEPYEESLHISYLESLLQSGLIKHAISHYNYVKSHVCRELGIKPSWMLQSIHRKIQSCINDEEEINMQHINKILPPEDTEGGALFCDMENFRLLYNVCQRNSSRAEIPGCICLVTLSQDNPAQRSKNNPDKVSESFKEFLRFSFRKGDVFALWNDSQAIVLLPSIKDNGYKAIEKRTRKNFSTTPWRSAYSLSIQFQPVTQQTGRIYASTSQLQGKKALP
jgi:two-component SAPR family response regulator